MNLLYDSGSSNQCSDNLDESHGVESETGSRERGHMYPYVWLIHVDVLQKTTQYGKTITLQLKINTFFK